jgi:hypothetical protein
VTRFLEYFVTALLNPYRKMVIMVSNFTQISQLKRPGKCGNWNSSFFLNSSLTSKYQRKPVSVSVVSAFEKPA